ncbi:MAG: sulfotransferase domain-containing protein [Gammaproteobacteria bacterium]|jgi:hypothetical protein
MKVDFLIVGTQKDGTTALHHFLNQTPGLCLPKVKEVHFFDNEEFFAGEPDYNLYHNHFSHHQAGDICGEATPIYMHWKPAAERILQYNPNMKLICCLRNPVDHRYSHDMTERQRGYETQGFSYALRLERQRRLSEHPLQHRLYSHAKRGYHSRKILQPLKLFPRKNMLFVNNEDLQHQRDDILTKAWDFIGVTPSASLIPMERITSNDYIPMPASDRTDLSSPFRAESSRLEELLGWNLREWRS